MRGAKDDRHSEKKVDVFDYSTRVSAHRPMQDYSLWHCLGYVFYAPLYLAGPTITYNAYVSHVGTLNYIYILVILVILCNIVLKFKHEP